MANNVKYLSYEGLEYFWNQKLKPIIEENEQLIAVALNDLNNKLNTHTHMYVASSGYSASAARATYAASAGYAGTADVANKVANVLTIQANGTVIDSYDGSAAKTVNITSAGIGALALTGGAMTGPITFNFTDADLNVIRINSGTGTDSTIGKWGFTLKYLGSGGDINNALALYADNSTAAEQNLATKWLNNGTMYSRSIIPHTKNDFDLGSSSLNWKNVYATKFTGSGFVHSGVTNDAANTVLTADGGYKSISDIMSLADAMVFKDTITSNSQLPAIHKQGWTYRVNTAGTYAGKVCEVGDLIICITDGTSTNNAHWTVAQTNTDGVVSGPASSVSGNIAAFNSTNGKSIYNTGLALSNIATSGHTHSYLPFEQSVNSKDMDTIKTTGFYYGYNMTNSASTNISSFIVTKYSPDWGSQIQLCHSNQRAYIRYWKNTGGIMGDWKTLAYLSDIPTTAADIGAASSDHVHNASHITTGILPVNRGGTGLSTIATGHVIIGNGTGTPTTSKIVSITNAEIDTIFTK